MNRYEHIITLIANFLVSSIKTELTTDAVKEAVSEHRPFTILSQTLHISSRNSFRIICANIAGEVKDEETVKGNAETLLIELQNLGYDIYFQSKGRSWSVADYNLADHLYNSIGGNEVKRDPLNWKFA